MNENAFFLQMDAGVWVIVKLQSKVQTSVSLLFKAAHESSKIDLKIDFFHENSLGNNM